MTDQVQYLSAESLKALKAEHEQLVNIKIPEIAKHIDEARQQGDLSENAEYHQAREDMSWARGRLNELEQIIENAQIIEAKTGGEGVQIGQTVVVKVNGNEKEYTIVGPQEANPAAGKISNESPLGEAFLGHKAGDKVKVQIPSGEQIYQIIKVK